MATPRARKGKPSTAVTTPMPPKIDQPHGGQIYRGGVPGNRGGGRPPSAVRALAREKFDGLIPTLDTIARAKKTKDSDKIRAIDVLGSYAMGHQISIDDVRELVRRIVGEIRDYLPREQADALLAKLEPHVRTL